MESVAITFYIQPSLTNVVLLSKPTLHNGKVWFCFDEPTCQKVVYWSVGGLFPNQWVYSLNGLDGTNITSWLNSNSDYPVETIFANWGTVGGSVEQITDSSYHYVAVIPSDPCIDNDFITCFNNLFGYFSVTQINELLDIGILEQGSISQLSALCQVKNVLLQINPSFTPTQVYNYMIALLEVGLVVSKNTEQECEGFIGSVEAYINYKNPI